MRRGVLNAVGMFVTFFEVSAKSKNFFSLKHGFSQRKPRFFRISNFFEIRRHHLIEGVFNGACSVRNADRRGLVVLEAAVFAGFGSQSQPAPSRQRLRALLASKCAALFKKRKPNFRKSVSGRCRDVGQGQLPDRVSWCRARGSGVRTERFRVGYFRVLRGFGGAAAPAVSSWPLVSFRRISCRGW